MAIAVFVFFIGRSAYGANHVRVDTISNVAPGTSGLSIGVYVTNDVPIVGFVLPLEFRTCSRGAYFAGPAFSQRMNLAGRMNNSRTLGGWVQLYNHLMGPLDV